MSMSKSIRSSCGENCWVGSLLPACWPVWPAFCGRFGCLVPAGGGDCAALLLVLMGSSRDPAGPAFAAVPSAIAWSLATYFDFVVLDYAAAVLGGAPTSDCSGFESPAPPAFFGPEAAAGTTCLFFLPDIWPVGVRPPSRSLTSGEPSAPLAAEPT